MQRTFRAILIFLLVVTALDARQVKLDSSPAETDASKHIQVVIVGVPEFSINAYQNKILSAQITKRCKDVRTFFRDRFKSQVDFHIRCSKNNTTRESLRTLFQGELPKFAANNLTLIFIMTHGEIDDSRHNNFVSPDLTLVTSDSVHPDEESWRLSTISVGADLMAWLEDVPEGSTILTFLDTCHGGAAANLSTKIQGSLAQMFGLRMLVLASSIAQEKAYGASFTQALLNQWATSKICLTDAHFSEDITDRIVGIVGGIFSPYEGIPQPIVRFNGDLCLPLNKLQAGKTRLLLIYSGVSPAPTSFSVRSADTDIEVTKGTLIENPLQLLRLLPGSYKVVVTEEGSSPVNKVVDLTSEEPGMVFVRDLRHPKAVAVAYKAAADGAESIGLPAAEVAGLRKQSIAISLANNDSAGAAIVQAALRKSGDEDAHLETLHGLAFKNLETIQSYIVELNSSREVVGRRLILTGDFANAATLLEQSLSVISDGEKRKMLAQLTYYTYGAAGEPAEAERVRSAYTLSLDDAYVVGERMPDLEQGAKNSKEAADTFRSMATINMMIALKKSNTSETDVRSHDGSATEWQQDILWSVRNSDAGGSIDCPNEYVPVAPECIAVGGRSCLMRKAIDAADVNHQAEAVRLSLITQCHNPAAANQIRNLGPQALTAYLTSTAAESMGERLWVGFGNVKVDFTEARKYFLIAANHGNARGMANVGWIYENGFDVPQDYSEAKFWYDKAISHGDIIANWNIGRLYEFGWGVQKNLDAARSWYQKGADKGHAASKQALDNVGHNNPMKM